MGIEFVRLPAVDPAALIELMNSPSVRKHLPLASGEFDLAACGEFVAAKERIWTEHGYGPWGFVADGTLAGWGGPQPEGPDVDIALVLARHSWGLGERIHREIVRRAFGELGIESVTALLPPSRGAARALLRLGYTPDGDTVIDGHRFLRHRLARPPRGHP